MSVVASTAVVLIVMFDHQLKPVAVHVTFPLIPIVLVVWRVVAVVAFPVTFHTKPAVE